MALVILQYDDGEYYFRMFKPGNRVESYLAPDNFHGDDECRLVPDAVVEAYAIHAAQSAAMQAHLAMLDEHGRCPKKEPGYTG